MITLHIEHAITDYGVWRAAFDRFSTARREAGVVSERVARPVDDPRHIVLDLDFDSRERAASFLRFLENQVWASPTSAPALDGRPRTAILAPAAPVGGSARIGALPSERTHVGCSTSEEDAP